MPDLIQMGVLDKETADIRTFIRTEHRRRANGPGTIGLSIIPSSTAVTGRCVRLTPAEAVELAERLMELAVRTDR